MEHKGEIDQDPATIAAAEPKSPPPSVNDEIKIAINGNGEIPGPPVEDDAEDPKKKKKSGKKSRRSSLTNLGKPSPKTGRKQLADDVDNVACKSEHKRRSVTTQKMHRQARRASMGSMGISDKNPIPESTAMLKLDNVPDPTDNSESTDNLSPPIASTSNRSFDSYASQKSRATSNRSFDSNKSGLRTASNHSLDSAKTPLSLSRPSSFHSYNSDLKNPKLGSHIGNGKKKQYDGDDFASDIEDETLCSFDNINLVIKNAENYLEMSSAPTPPSDKDSAPIVEQKLQEERKSNPDAKPRKKRQPQLRKTDELGRSSGHYKLEGVYINQRTDRKAVKNESEDGNGDIEVLTKPPAESIENDGRHKTPVKSRMRSRRRASIGDEALTNPRSRSSELTSPRSRSKEITSPGSGRSRSSEKLTSPRSARSRSSELISPRNSKLERRGSLGDDGLTTSRSRSKELTSPRHKGKGRAPKDFTRSTDPLNTRSSHLKSSDKRVKRGSAANMISPESKEAVNKLFGMEAASEDDTNVAKDMISENQPSSPKDPEEKPLVETEETATDNRSPSKDAEEESKQVKPPSKSVEKKQRRRSSIGNTMKKEKPSVHPEDMEKELLAMGIPVSLEETTEQTLEETENSASENPAVATIQVSKPVKPSSKSLEKKQRRRSSMGKSMKKERTALEPKDVEKELVELCSTSPEDNSNDQETVEETENSKSENHPSPTANETEKNDENAEKGSKKMDSSTENVEKKQRRRNSLGKVPKKDRQSTRKLLGKSSHKIAKKSMREKKGQTKDAPISEVESSTEMTSPSPSEDFVTGSEEINGIPNQEAKDLSKKPNGVEKVSKKDRTSSRRSSVKERKKGEKDSPAESIPQIDTKPENNPESEANTNDVEDTEELIMEDLNDTKKAFRTDIFIKQDSQRSLHDYLSSHHSQRELDVDSVCTDTGSFFSASVASDESKELQEGPAGDANYLQLTFVAENGTDGNNLFALMDEKMNRSFQELDEPENEERGSTLRSFVSFTDEIDVKVSTTSYHLSTSKPPPIRIADDVSTDDYLSAEFSADDGFSADEDFPCNDNNEFANATWDAPPRPRLKKFSTPIARKKKLSPFGMGMSKSLHDFGGVHHDANTFADANMTPRRKKRGMLQKMANGISEGGKRTFQKAASTRNIFEQATTKVLSRRKEEGRGLLTDDDDDFSD